MKKNNILKRFRDDKRGSAYVMAAFALVPMFGMTALAIDYTNHDRIRTDLETAAETVALHIAKRVALDPNRPASEFVAEGQSIFASLINVPVTYDQFNVDTTSGKVQIIARTDVKTHFMHMFGHDELSAITKTEARFGRQSIEVAIAIDNSGSMAYNAAGDAATEPNSRMRSAKDATELLIKAASGAVDSLSNADIKFSVIPWNMHVRVPESERGTENNQKAWIDWNGKSVDHFRYLPPYKNGGDMYFNMPSRDSSWPDDSQDDEYTHYDPNNLKQVFDDNNLLIAGDEGVDLTALENMSGINLITRADVYNRFSNASWKGCFDHRAGAYKTSFAAPNVIVGNSLYLPHFAPDEYDVDYNADNGWEWQYRNDYIGDVGGDSDFAGGYGQDQDGVSSALKSSNAHDGGNLSMDPDQKNDYYNDMDIKRARTMNTAKYAGTGTITTKDKDHPWWGENVGPDINCFVPEMTGLSDNVDGINNDNSPGILKQTIDSMSPLGGTDASIGLSWAMNTLTPHEPYNDAGAFNDTQKILVILTDGTNDALQPQDYRLSATPHGFIMDDPLDKGWSKDGPTDADAGDDVLDEVSKEMCTNIRNSGVKLYFVYFGQKPEPGDANYTKKLADFERAEELRESCASTPETAIYAANDAQLTAAFEKIGDDIGKLRLTHYQD